MLRQLELPKRFLIYNLLNESEWVLTGVFFFQPKMIPSPSMGTCSRLEGEVYVLLASVRLFCSKGVRASGFWKSHMFKEFVLERIKNVSKYVRKRFCSFSASWERSNVLGLPASLRSLLDSIMSGGRRVVCSPNARQLIGPWSLHESYFVPDCFLLQERSSLVAWRFLWHLFCIMSR